MPKPKKEKICIIVPAYNEGLVIGSVIETTIKRLRRHNFSFEVVVINDGSIDNTSSEAQKANAVVIDHILNFGAGGATSTGLRYAEKNNFDIAITMDADGQHDPEDVIKGIKLSQSSNIDLLIGSRLINASGMNGLKLIGNKGLTFITWVLFGVNVTDSQSGLRVFSKKALDTLEWKSTSYDFCSEMLWRAKQSKLSIEEFPISVIYSDYSKSKGQSNWNGINIVKSLVHRRLVEIFE